MPALRTPMPLLDVLERYRAGVRRTSRTDDRRDVREGSGFEAPGGVASVLARRFLVDLGDRARSRLEHGKRGDALDAWCARVYGVARQARSQGTGYATFTVNGSGATLTAGTRLRLYSDAGTYESYEVSSDTAVTSSAVLVPVRAVRYGRGVAVDRSSSSGVNAQMDALLADSSATNGVTRLLSIAVADGSDGERDDECLARARREFREARTGYRASIVRTLKRAGATDVVLRSDLDVSATNGVSYVYVSDSGDTTTQATLDACMVALDSCAPAGALVQVCGMTRTPVDVSAALETWDSPSFYQASELRHFAETAVAAELAARVDSWYFSAAGFSGAIMRALPMVARVGIGCTPSEPDPGDLPAVLPRYYLRTFTATIAQYDQESAT